MLQTMSEQEIIFELLPTKLAQIPDFICVAQKRKTTAQIRHLAVLTERLPGRILYTMIIRTVAKSDLRQKHKLVSMDTSTNTVDRIILRENEMPSACINSFS